MHMLDIIGIIGIAIAVGILLLATIGESPKSFARKNDTYRNGVLRNKQEDIRKYGRTF